MDGENQLLMFIANSYNDDGELKIYKLRWKIQFPIYFWTFYCVHQCFINMSLGRCVCFMAKLLLLLFYESSWHKFGVSFIINVYIHTRFDQTENDYILFTNNHLLIFILDIELSEISFSLNNDLCVRQNLIAFTYDYMFLAWH